jgi:hypothetical protein
MTARRPIAEKIMALVGTYNALMTELTGVIDLTDARVQAELINAAGLLVMSSDTRDMGIMAPAPKHDPGDHFMYPDNVCDDCGLSGGAHDIDVNH